ncbi:MAG: CooT family nickel-binding protein [Candidatus Bathyarchaeia archaeon]|nr:CooT family nickel-binding protein [Candidatus Bathyarchaeota archaeon]
MCLLKVYFEDPCLGRRLIVENVILISREGNTIRILDAEMNETVLSDAEIATIDALNSTLILKRPDI